MIFFKTNFKVTKNYIVINLNHKVDNSMAEDIKSSLHDAVPSWNGFNYQGKIGLYVCLKNILNKLNECDLNSKEFNKFLNTYSIEYEWIEDFSIKDEKKYISLHQVKHKGETKFSSHLSAVVTILNRKLCRLSETDFMKYIHLNYDYNGCNSEEDRNERKYKIIQNKIDEIKQAGYLDEHYRLAEEWEKIDEKIEDIEKSDLIKLLSDFQIFTDNTFLNSKVYFHTSEKVNEPKNELHTYKGMPIYHHSTVNGLKSLSSLNIFMGFDIQNDYILEMDDDEIFNEINKIVKYLLNITLSSELISNEQILIYQAILLKIIDQHVVNRHKNIRSKLNIGEGFLETRDTLKFIEIFTPLKSLIQKQDLIYWENFCMKIFEEAYLEEIVKLEKYIKENKATIVNQRKKYKLESYRSIIFCDKIDSYTTLLIRLSPHIKKKTAFDVFYNQIAHKETIKDTFLYFIQSIENDNNNFIVNTKNNLKIHPSTISFISKPEEDWEYCVLECQHSLQENESLFYSDATHLVAKTAQGHEITNIPIKLKSLVENIEEGQQNKEYPIITDISPMKFISAKDALKEINNDVCG